MQKQVATATNAWHAWWVGLEMPPNENPADWMSAPQDDLKKDILGLTMWRYPHKE